MNNKLLKTVAGEPDKPLIIGDIEIPCYVLEDETRVLAQRGMFLGLGASRGGANNPTGAHLPRFMASKALQPFISNELALALNSPILFQIPKGNIRAYGYPATLLPDICDTFIEARNAEALQKQQIHIAERCEILIRGFARIGIIGLVDEATGYQNIRASKALAQILEKFIAKELQPWTSTFPEEFYKEMFRLKKWEWQPWTVKRPSVIGHYTNDIVYKRIAPEILSELKKLNPTNEAGNRPNRHHQWFNREYGHPKLKEHLAAVIALMKASPNWVSFNRSLQRAFPKIGDQGILNLDED